MVHPFLFLRWECSGLNHHKDVPLNTNFHNRLWHLHVNPNVLQYLANSRWQLCSVSYLEEYWQLAGDGLFCCALLLFGAIVQTLRRVPFWLGFSNLQRYSDTAFDLCAVCGDFIPRSDDWAPESEPPEKFSAEEGEMSAILGEQTRFSFRVDSRCRMFLLWNTTKRMEICFRTIQSRCWEWEN